MSRHGSLIAAISLAVCTMSRATSTPRHECPSVLHDGDSTYAYSHVEVFDGPPQQMTSLIPVPIKNGAQWDMTKEAEVYLVCGYKGTARTITVDAPDTIVCKAFDTPGSTAFCD